MQREAAAASFVSTAVCRSRVSWRPRGHSARPARAGRGSRHASRQSPARSASAAAARYRRAGRPASAGCRRLCFRRSAGTLGSSSRLDSSPPRTTKLTFRTRSSVSSSDSVALPRLHPHSHGGLGCLFTNARVDAPDRGRQAESESDRHAPCLGAIVSRGRTARTNLPAPMPRQAVRPAGSTRLTTHIDRR